MQQSTIDAIASTICRHPGKSTILEITGHPETLRNALCQQLAESLKEKDTPDLQPVKYLDIPSHLDSATREILNSASPCVLNLSCPPEETSGLAETNAELLSRNRVCLMLHISQNDHGEILTLKRLSQG